MVAFDFLIMLVAGTRVSLFIHNREQLLLRLVRHYWQSCSTLTGDGLSSAIVDGTLLNFLPTRSSSKQFRTLFERRL